MLTTPSTCDEMRALIGAFLKRGDSEAQRLWDIITCQRGPDAPSERDDMPREEFYRAYDGRRERKHKTGEVIRAKSFGGTVGGSARSRTDIHHVTLPPKGTWDHYDRHVWKAAQALGIEVVIEEVGEGKKERKGDRCKVEVGTGKVSSSHQIVSGKNYASGNGGGGSNGNKGYDLKLNATKVMEETLKTYYFDPQALKENLYWSKLLETAWNLKTPYSPTAPPSKQTGLAECGTGGTSMKEEEESSPF